MNNSYRGASSCPWTSQNKLEKENRTDRQGARISLYSLEGTRWKVPGSAGTRGMPEAFSNERNPLNNAGVGDVRGGVRFVLNS